MGNWLRTVAVGGAFAICAIGPAHAVAVSGATGSGISMSISAPVGRFSSCSLVGTGPGKSAGPGSKAEATQTLGTPICDTSGPAVVIQAGDFDASAESSGTEIAYSGTDSAYASGRVEALSYYNLLQGDALAFDLSGSIAWSSARDGVDLPTHGRFARQYARSNILIYSVVSVFTPGSGWTFLDPTSINPIVRVSGGCGLFAGQSQIRPIPQPPSADSCADSMNISQIGSFVAPSDGFYRFNFYMFGGGETSVYVAPEPGTLALLGLGLAGLGLSRRRRYN